VVVVVVVVVMVMVAENDACHVMLLRVHLTLPLDVLVSVASAQLLKAMISSSKANSSVPPLSYS
jgi:hypothetical protein